MPIRDQKFFKRASLGLLPALVYYFGKICYFVAGCGGDRLIRKSRAAEFGLRAGVLPDCRREFLWEGDPCPNLGPFWPITVKGREGVGRTCFRPGDTKPAVRRKATNRAGDRLLCETLLFGWSAFLAAQLAGFLPSVAMARYFRGTFARNLAAL